MKSNGIEFIYLLMQYNQITLLKLLHKNIKKNGICLKNLVSSPNSSPILKILSCDQNWRQRF